MTSICREIFRAIHEGKWLSIEYKNKDEGITKFWIAIKSLNPQTKALKVDGLHLGLLSIMELHVHIEAITSATVVEGSYFPVNQDIVDDIRLNPNRYVGLFSCAANLRVLNYLEECNKLDATPYKTDYSLITCLDGDCLTSGAYTLHDDQFSEIVQYFQMRNCYTRRCKCSGSTAGWVVTTHDSRG